MTLQIDRVAASPELFPHLRNAVDDTLGFVALSEADYRAASFLDARSVAGRPQMVVARSEVAAALATSSPCCHFIFHIGHVGSTLLSRLTGEHPRLFALREPELLRDFSAAADDVEFLLLRLWSRKWREGQTAVVKATSFVSESADGLLRTVPAARALLMFASPLAYLRGVFGGEGSRRELGTMAPRRLERLARRLRLRPEALQVASEGEAVAMSWLCEMACLHATAAAHPTRVTWMNFDQFLASAAEGLQVAWAGLGVPADAELARAVSSGPIMRRYSKAPEHEYDAALRHEVARLAERRHSAEIARGMAWLGAAALRVPLVRSVLEDAAGRKSPALATVAPGGPRRL